MTKPKRPRLIIFDLDGTLIDSRPDITAAFNRVLSSRGIPTVSEALVASYIATGIRPLLAAIAKVHNQTDTTALFAEFDDTYANCLLGHTKLYPGINDVLNAYQDLPKVVLSNKLQRFVAPILTGLGIVQQFQYTFGREAFPTTKPDPLPILRICDSCSVAPGDTLMIGDTPTDMIAAEFAACVNEFLHQNKLSSNQIDAIGSHGQTIYHGTSTESVLPASLQMGAPSIIAELTGITTIGNFRPRDIAVGGQGAPLVAFADYVLHIDEPKPTGLLNLGSIANITVLTENLQDTMAFDLGPANMPIDYFAARDCINGIDQDGSISQQGNVIYPLLEDLQASPYFEKCPPKAAGYGEFGPGLIAKICHPYLDRDLPDLLCTAVEFSAVTLSSGLRSYVLPIHPELKKIKVSGGGIYNKTLMRRIRQLLPELSIEPLNDRYADAKEALAFAILAHTTLSGMPGNVPNATGATKSVVLGEIAL
jgi:anhydro-N-acetylmuramic acid kinase